MQILIQSRSRWSGLLTRRLISASHVFPTSGFSAFTQSFGTVPTKGKRPYNDRTMENRASRKSKSSEVSSNVLPDGTLKHRKMKVALVVGYVGSKYHGLQHNGNSDCITVEEVLEKALFDIGCITDSNHKDISKIGWSRSSRTDRGVHAARVIIGVKLQVDPTLVIDDFRIPTIVEKLNVQLPDDVRVFSCCRMANSFRARKLVNWREYEYLLPIDFLRASDTPVWGAGADYSRWRNPPNDSAANHELNYLNWQTMQNIYDEKNSDFAVLEKTDEELIENLQTQLNKMVGVKSFHNFCNTKTKNDHLIGNEERLLSRTLKPRPMSRAEEDGQSISASPSCDTILASMDSMDSDGKEQEEEREEENEFTDTFDDYIVEDDADADQLERYSFHIYNPDEFKEEWFYQQSLKSFLTTIYSFKVKGVYSSEIGGSPGATGNTDHKMIRLRIRGQSFMLNQIRLMIGAAVASVRGLIPRDMIEFALMSSMKIRLPKVPAEGLCLIQNGFERNPEGEIFVLQEMLSSSLNSDKQLPGSEIPIMTAEEFERSEKFFHDRILPQIYQDCYPATAPSTGDSADLHDSDDEVYVQDRLGMADEWLTGAERFRIPKKFGEKWTAQLVTEKEKLQKLSELRGEKGSVRVDKLLLAWDKMVQSGVFAVSDLSESDVQAANIWQTEKQSTKVLMKTIKRTKIIRVGNMSSLQKLVTVYAIVNAIGPVENRRLLSHEQAAADVFYVLATKPALAECWLRASYKMFENLSYHGADKSRAATSWFLPHRVLLPNQLNTEVVIRFELIPGDFAYKIQCSLALRILQGEIEPGLSAEALADYVAHSVEQARRSDGENKSQMERLVDFCENVRNFPWIE